MAPLDSVYQVLTRLATRRNIKRLIVASGITLLILAPIFVHVSNFWNVAGSTFLATLLGGMFAALLSIGKMPLDRRLLWVLVLATVVLLPTYYRALGTLALLPFPVAIQVFYDITVLFGYLGAIAGALIPFAIESFRGTPRWGRFSMAVFIPLWGIFYLTVGKLLFEAINAFELGSFTLVLAGLVLSRSGVPARLKRYSLGVGFVYFLCGTVLYLARAYSFPQTWTPLLSIASESQSGPAPATTQGLLLIGAGLDAGFLTACLALLYLTIRLAALLLEEENRDRYSSREIYR